MSPQEENAAILRQLWSMGETMFDGILARLTKTVEQVEPKYKPGLCGRCFNYREHTRDLPNGDYEMVDCLECLL